MTADVRAVVICDDCCTVAVGKPERSVIALERDLERDGWRVLRGGDTGRLYNVCPGCIQRRKGGPMPEPVGADEPPRPIGRRP